jgi:hypothetical protein
MSLADLQRALARLVRGEPPLSADPYVAAVAASPQLAVTREVVLWWRAFGVGRTCPLTATLLKRSGAFDAFVGAFVQSVPITPYVEVLGERFLRFVSECSEPLVAAVARFEAAIVALKRSETVEVRVEWPCDPNAVLLWLAAPPGGQPLAAAAGAYVTVIGRNQPHGFTVLRRDAPPGSGYAPGTIAPPAVSSAWALALDPESALTPRPATGGSPRPARSASGR